jgi:hypothetical protein
LPGLGPVPPELKRTTARWSAGALLALGALTAVCVALTPWDFRFAGGATMIGAIFILACRDRFRQSRAQPGAQRDD